MDDKTKKILMGYLVFIIVGCLAGTGVSMAVGPSLADKGSAKAPAAEGSEDGAGVEEGAGAK